MQAVSTIQHLYFQPAQREEVEEIVDAYRAGGSRSNLYRGLRYLGMTNEAALSYMALVESTLIID